MPQRLHLSPVLCAYSQPSPSSASLRIPGARASAPAPPSPPARSPYWPSRLVASGQLVPASVDPALSVLPLFTGDRALPVSPKLPRSPGFPEAGDRTRGKATFASACAPGPLLAVQPLCCLCAQVCSPSPPLLPLPLRLGNLTPHSEESTFGVFHHLGPPPNTGEIRTPHLHEAKANLRAGLSRGQGSQNAKTGVHTKNRPTENASHPICVRSAYSIDCSKFLFHKGLHCGKIHRM